MKIYLPLLLLLPLSVSAQDWIAIKGQAPRAVDIQNVNAQELIFLKNDSVKALSRLPLPSLDSIHIEDRKELERMAQANSKVWKLNRPWPVSVVGAKPVEFVKEQNEPAQAEEIQKRREAYYGNRSGFRGQTEQYAEIMFIGKLFSAKVNAVIDSGQARGFFEPKAGVTENGRRVEFNSVVDGLNYMNSLGYEFVNAFAVSIPNSGQVYHYLFKRRVQR